MGLATVIIKAGGKPPRGSNYQAIPK